MESLPRARLSGCVHGGERPALPREPLLHDPWGRDGGPAARACRERSAILQPAPGPAQAHRRHERTCGDFRSHGKRQIHDARRINLSRARNILTLEAPLEYIFTNHKSFIRQREIPTHCASFEQALVDALRENPDVLVVGEMRTPEVIRLTLNAAETGHLVLATMHSATCGEALSRICMSFPAETQGSIRAQLADVLVGVVCQRLEFLAPLQLRVPKCEILFGSSATKATIRSGQMTQIANVILSGGDDGMWTLDRYQRWMEQKNDWVRPAARPAGAMETFKPMPKPTAAGPAESHRSPGPGRNLPLLRYPDRSRHQRSPSTRSSIATSSPSSRARSRSAPGNQAGGAERDHGARTPALGGRGPAGSPLRRYELSMAAANPSNRRSSFWAPISIRPTGAVPGSWQGIEMAQRSRKLVTAVLRRAC